ncbi:MAG: RNA methyltransferase [Myxococcales bacterium]|nr:MAG: RNA methyltransferase [Myxococcales bacterium]
MSQALPRVVLVGPRGGANVGAVCRAIMNMGGGDLYVVDGNYDTEQAAIMAVHARPVHDARRDVTTLREAIRGCSVVVGTTARKGPYRERSRDVRAAAAGLVRAENQGATPVAIVFGPEDTGLTNEDIAVCHDLVFIPTTDAYQSLNLAQAVMVVLYEIHRARLDVPGEESSADPDESSLRLLADAGAVEEMFGGLERALVDVGFLPSENPKHIMVTLRALFGRAALDDRELRILRGIIRQIRWYVDGGREVALAKSARGENLK